MSTTAKTDAEHFDAIVIGAGIAGLYQLYRLRKLGLSVLVFEDAPDVGGTWYWNCYPGARFDSESYSYAYFFSKELFEEWTWSEHFAAQSETLRYMRHVADRFDLRRHIRFNSRVEHCAWNEADKTWSVHAGGGQRVRAKYLITAVGVLSATHMPHLPGIEEFKGQAYHSSRWPQGGVNLKGKRVGVIGTGSTGVQIIQTIADEVDRLVVFQRTPTYCAPLRNAPVTAAEHEAFSSSYDALLERLRGTPGGFIHSPDERRAMEVPENERLAYYEKKWAEPGFGKWLGLYSDSLSDPAANETAAAFVRNKIRQRINDPAVAEKLIPRNQPFGAKRIPLETHYYEVYNRKNVHLVDIRSEPISRIYGRGIRTSAAEYELDVIIFATGFDAITGNLVRIDIRGTEGISLADSFKSGPHSFMGLQVAGFPNLFTISGPLGGFVFCNVPRCLEENIDWITDCIDYMRSHAREVIEPSAEAERLWNETVQEGVRQTLLSGTDSWFNGANIPGKARAIQMYVGGLVEFRRLYQEMVSKGYEGFEFR
jgi:cation diffusion facilitator CzcD-associated flavoprotein CzcO